MINLLPYDTLKEIKAGRTNSLLLSFIIMLLVAVIFVAAITGLAYIALVSERNDVRAREAESQQNLASRSEDVKKVEAFSSNLTDAKKITEVQARYSQIFIAIGKALPKNTVIKDLSISPANIDVGIDMTIYTKTKKAMTDTKNSMLKNKEQFSDVSFNSVDYKSCDPNGVRYRCEAVVNVQLNKEVLYFGNEGVKQ